MNILNFENVFQDTKVIKLEQNYRSSKTILDVANAVIANNTSRKQKKLWTDREDEEPVYLRTYDSGRDEAMEIGDEIARMKKKGVADYGDFAVLYRTNAQSREFEEYFVRQNIPYQLVGGVNFYARKEIKDILCYLKTIDNARDDLAVKRIINVPKRGIGLSSVAKVSDYADLKDMTFLDACKVADTIPELSKAAATKIINFTSMIEAYKGRLKDYSIREMTQELLDDTAYIEEISSEDEEKAEDRIQNIDELLSKIAQFEEEHPDGTLSEFLEEVALISDLDNVDGEASRVVLMTIHSSKGLEFPIVYLSGMEEGIFPSYMTINSGSEADMEEERRLAYVAITRAENRLTLSYAKSRMIRGETQYNPLSRFVKEIPRDLLSGEMPRERFRIDERYEENSAPRSFMRDNPYGGNDGFIPRKVSVNPMPKKAVMTTEEAKAKLASVSKGSNFILNELSYSEGDRVKHVKFGQGTVLKIEKGPRDFSVTVNFDDFGNKIMYASFAKLEKV